MSVSVEESDVKLWINPGREGGRLVSRVMWVAGVDVVENMCE